MTDERERYNIKMDALTRQVARTLAGEDLIDVAQVCSALAAFAIAEMPVSRAEREEILKKVTTFMRHRVFAEAAEFADGRSQQWTRQ